MQRLAGPVALVSGDLSRIVKVLVPVYGLLKGIPTDATMAAFTGERRRPTRRPTPTAIGAVCCV